MHDRQQVLNHFLFGDNCSLFSTSNSVPCSHKAILVGYCDTRLECGPCHESGRLRLRPPPTYIRYTANGAEILPTRRWFFISGLCAALDTRQYATGFRDACGRSRRINPAVPWNRHAVRMAYARVSSDPLGPNAEAS
jgi:hypothetical protein